MTEFVNIDQIDELERGWNEGANPPPFYILIAGGMAVGKTHVVSEHIKRIPFFDIDEIMINRGFLEYTREQFAIAMEEITKLVEDQMDHKASMVAMGTASNTTLAIDRLHAAKMKGYKTVLIHIDAPVSQAVKQNILRIQKGERGVSKSDEHKIEKTVTGAAQTVAVLRESSLVDYFVYYNNTRKEMNNE